ncbi:MAG TPA: hypothetical protein VGE59_00925, partial [Patescibacteria group bacterium]
FAFYLRPRFYIFTKNDPVHRTIVLPETKQEELVIPATIKLEQVRQQLSFDEQMRIDRLLESDSLTLSFELAKKGGIDVSLVPIKD